MSFNGDKIMHFFSYGIERHISRLGLACGIPCRRISGAQTRVRGVLQLRGTTIVSNLVKLLHLALEALPAEGHQNVGIWRSSWEKEQP